MIERETHMPSKLNYLLKVVIDRVISLYILDFLLNVSLVLGLIAAMGKIY